MAFTTRIAGTAALAAAILMGYGLSAPPTQAGYIVTLTQVADQAQPLGFDVVASGSGTIDLTDLRSANSGGSSPGMEPSLAQIATGLGGSQPFYTGLTGPTNFGSGGTTFATTGSGDLVTIIGRGSNFFPNVLGVPQGYASGGPLSDTATYDNATFASLGVTPGTYVWTWGTGVHADSFTLNVETAAVPEPSSLALLGLPLGLLMLLAARYRRDIPIEL